MISQSPVEEISQTVDFRVGQNYGERQVRRGVISLLQAQTDFQVSGEASNGFEAVGMAEQLQPDVIVLDISLPGLNGLAAARQIRRLAPSSQILFFSQHSAPEMIREAMRTGAAGYVCKADAGQELVDAISCSSWA